MSKYIGCCHLVSSAKFAFVQMWYAAQMKMICEWLSDRLDIALHPYQLTCLLNIVRVSCSNCCSRRSCSCSSSDAFESTLSESKSKSRGFESESKLWGSQSNFSWKIRTSVWLVHYLIYVKHHWVVVVSVLFWCLLDGSLLPFDIACNSSRLDGHLH